MSTGNSEYSEEELAGLSEEERAAIVGDDEDHEGGDAGDEPAGDEGEDGASASGEDEGADAGEDEGEEGEDDKSAPEDAKAPEPQKVERQPEHVRLPEEVTAEFKARQDSLNEQFENGDITMAELLDGRDKINREIYNAEADASKQANAENAWQDAQYSFFKGNKHYLEEQNQKRYATLNVCVKAVAGSEDAASMSLSEILAKAKSMEEAMSGVASTTKEPAKEEKPPKSKLPDHQSLSEIPAAAPTETGKPNEFSYMENLVGLEYEKAIDAMSEAQRDRFLKG